MKKLIVLSIVSMIFTGCANKHTYRTGTLCIEPFKTANYTTSDPIDVKPDIVNKIALQIPPAMEIHIPHSSKLKVTKCNNADYRLVGSVVRVDTMLNSERKGIGASTQRTFAVGVRCELKDNRTQKTLMVIEESKDRDTLQDTLNALGDKIGDEIRYEQTNAAPVKAYSNYSETGNEAVITKSTSLDQPKVTQTQPVVPSEVQPVKSKTETNVTVQSSNPSPVSMIVIGNKAKIRIRPTTNAAVVTTLKKGDIVQLIKQKNEWCQIELASGDIGWCHKSVLSHVN